MNTLCKVFYSPGEVFAGIPEKPRWYLPFVSTLVLSCLTLALVANSIGMENLARRQLRSQPRLVEQLGEEKIDEIARQANAPARQVAAYISSVLGSGIIILVVAGILSALLALTGAKAGFCSVFSVTAYSYFAYYSVLLAMSALTLSVISDKESIDPDNMLLSHAGAFLDRATTNKALYSIATSLDLFSFGLLFLMIFGLSKVSNRVTFARSTAVVVGAWAVYVAAKACVSSLF
ncbi:MAG TPA: YIP1 family protein [Blastocatellia bacterium]|nr:YIP1 family protein [Blastocatellia bacterium]